MLRRQFVGKVDKTAVNVVDFKTVHKATQVVIGEMQELDNKWKALTKEEYHLECPRYSSVYHNVIKFAQERDHHV